MISTSRKVFGIPVARRRNRRILVIAYACAIAAFAGAFFFDQARHTLDIFGILIALQMLTNLPALLGGIRAGGVVKPYRGVRWVAFFNQEQREFLFGRPAFPGGSLDPAAAELDERETRLRDRIHFLAYTLARWFALLLFAAFALIAAFRPGSLRQAGLFCFLLLVLILWSLPQTMILWTEPDLSTDPNTEPPQ